jgi:DNA repair protein SbcD/Mre11
MKIAHFADSHLGHPSVGLQRRVADPWRPGVMLRQREVDLLAGFERTITAILECHPQVVLHAGDLFDTARPSAHILSFAMGQLKRLSDAAIDMVLIEGNNSFPRDPALGHAHQILAHVPRVHAIFEESVNLAFDDVVVHAYPHRATAKGQWPVNASMPSDKFRILLGHGVADGYPFFRGDRPAATLNLLDVAQQFDYIALGHHHRFAQVPETEVAFYSGPTAMVTWADFRPGQQFGFCLIDTDSGLVEPQRLETRPMLAYGLDDAEGMSRTEVLDLLEQQIAELPCAGANCQVVARNIDPLARRELSVRDVESLFTDASALSITLSVREQRWEDVRSGLVAGGGLLERYRALVTQSDGDEEFKQEVQRGGLEVLELANEMVGEEELGEVAE